MCTLQIEPGKQPIAPSMPEYRTSDPLEQMFTNMVGASGEIDQFGLKQILDALMSQCNEQLHLINFKIHY